MAANPSEGSQGTKLGPTKHTPPYIPLSILRKKLGMGHQDVCDVIFELTGMRIDRSTLSGIEGGHRGTSQELLVAMAAVYDIEPRDIDVTYKLRRRQRRLMP